MTVPVEPELLLHQTDWTLEQYERVVAGGILTPEHRVELLFGKIVHKLALGDLHAFCVQELNYAMIERFGRRFTCRQEQPIALPEHSAPEPDYVLAALTEDRYFSRKPSPTEIHLTVEVSDSTLARDQGSKARLYGLFGIPEYWIINLIDKRVEVHSFPRGHTDKGGYERVEYFGAYNVFRSEVLGEIIITDFIPAVAWR